MDKHELYCQSCHHYVQFPLDLAINADYYISCPVCHREHCRVVHNHHITSHQKAHARGYPIDIHPGLVSSSKQPTTQGNQPHDHTW